MQNIGKECKKQGITEAWLLNPTEINVDFVNRELALELRSYKNRNQILDKTCALWFLYLCKLQTLPHLGRLCLSIVRTFNKKNKLKKEEKGQYLNGLFIPPKPTEKENKLNCNFCKKDKIEKDIIFNKTSCNSKMNKSHMKLKKEKMSMNLEIYNLKREIVNLTKKLDKYQEKIGQLNTRNVNKRIKHRNVKIQKLTEQNKKLFDRQKYLQKLICRIRQKNKQRTSLLKYYNQRVNIMKQGNTTNLKQSNTTKPVHDNNDKQVEHQIREENNLLKQNLHVLENENEEMKEIIEELMENQEISTFEKGKYNDTVREVYAALLSANVGVKNVEHIVRTVLNKLGGVKVGRLPRKTFSEIMLIEAKALAQIQSVDAILMSNDLCTIHTDGTKRKGREYGGLQIGTSSGQYSVGISELVQGTADSFFTMIKEIFNNLGELAGSDKENKDKKAAEILLKVKNMMTDRHVVNSSLKNMLEKWRTDCLPLIIENFNTFSDDLKKSLIDINHFKCNLHVLVNLGSQAEIALKEWAKAIIITDTFDWGVASTPDFIRARTKLCAPGADQKSGYSLLFETYLKSCTPPVALQMSTFYGHRIHMLFSMAAAVYYHNDHIKDFLSTYFEDKSSNKLVVCVSHYVNNKVYLAGCRALGIIDKLMTGPLWKQIENAKHILDLNSMWLIFFNYLDEFSRDSSNLLKGTILFPEFTRQDDIFDRLFSVQDEQYS